MHTDSLIRACFSCGDVGGMTGMTKRQCKFHLCKYPTHMLAPCSTSALHAFGREELRTIGSEKHNPSQSFALHVYRLEEGRAVTQDGVRTRRRNCATKENGRVGSSLDAAFTAVKRAIIWKEEKRARHGRPLRALCPIRRGRFREGSSITLDRALLPCSVPLPALPARPAQH